MCWSSPDSIDGGWVGTGGLISRSVVEASDVDWADDW